MMKVSDVIVHHPVPAFAKAPSKYFYTAETLKVENEARQAALREWVKRYRVNGVPDSCEGMLKREGA